MTATEIAFKTLDAHQRQQLLELARHSILCRLRGEQAVKISLREYRPALRRQLASFVTLHRDGRLRGCIGNLFASRALVEDVAHNAVAAAFEDPRFEALSEREYPGLELHISVLSAPRELPVTSREQLLGQLQPGVDGVILQKGDRRATYLPSVWEQLPDPDQFVAELLRKAGLSGTTWASDIKVSIYRTFEFSEENTAR